MSDTGPSSLSFDSNLARELSKECKYTDGVRKFVVTGLRKAIGKAPLRSYMMFVQTCALKDPDDLKSIDRGCKLNLFIGVPVPNKDADAAKNAGEVEDRRKKLATYCRMGGDTLRTLLGEEEVPPGFRQDPETEEWTFRGEPIPDDADRDELKAQHMDEIGNIICELWSDTNKQKELKGCTFFALTEYTDDGKYMQSVKLWADQPADHDLVDEDNWVVEEG